MSSPNRSDREQFHRLCSVLYPLARQHTLSEVLRGIEEVFQDGIGRLARRETGHAEDVSAKLMQARDAVIAFERYGVTTDDAAADGADRP